MKKLALFLAAALLVLAPIPAQATTINGQLIKAGLERLSADPTGFEGRFYLNTVSHLMRYYSNGAWTNASSPAALTASRMAALDGSGFLMAVTNLNASGNTISAVGTNQDLQFSPTGTGYIYFGTQNNNAVYPGSNFGLTLGANFTAGASEIDFWNSTTSATTSFNWYQRTGAGTGTLLASLLPSGNLSAAGKVFAIGNFDATAATNPYVQLNATTGSKTAFLQISGANLNLSPPSGGIVTASTGLTVSGPTSVTGLTRSYATKTTTYTLTSTDDFVTVDASGGSWTLAFPTAVGIAGRTYSITKINSDLNTVTLDPSGTETIAGLTTRVLQTQNESVEVYSDGANWRVRDHRTATDWVSFTPTGSWVSNATYTGFWRRSGNYLEVNVAIAVSGAPTATTLYVVLPSSLSWDTTVQSGGSSGIGTTFVGAWSARHSGVSSWSGSPSGATSQPTRVTFVPTSSDLVSNTVPFTWAAADSFSASYRVPVAGWWE